eukprot:753936-Hanusia_phi.AAC.3
MNTRHVSVSSFFNLRKGNGVACRVGVGSKNGFCEAEGVHHPARKSESARGEGGGRKERSRPALLIQRPIDCVGKVQEQAQRVASQRCSTALDLGLTVAIQCRTRRGWMA